MATPEEIATLASESSRLSAAVEKINGETGSVIEKLARIVKSHRRILRWVILSIVLDIGLTVVFGAVLTRVDGLTHRVDQSQTVSRQKALCPLYQILLSSDTKQARAAAVDKTAYDNAFRVVREGFEALKCSDFKSVPPTLGK